MAFQSHGAHLHVEVTRQGPDVLLVPVGELDLATVDALREAARTLLPDGPGRVTVDLGRLEFVDVIGVRALLALAEHLGPRLTVLPGSPPVQRVFELTGMSARLPLRPPDNVMPFPGAGERNLKYVQRLWKAFRRGGLEALAEMIPPGVEWRPWDGQGQAVKGPEELRAFYGSSGRAGPSSFVTVGENVLVRTEFPTSDGGSRPLFSLYEFSAGTLVRATSFEHESDLVSYTA